MKLTPFHLERFYDTYEFKVRTNISGSCGAETTVSDILDMAGEKAREEYLTMGLGYRPYNGDVRLREKIAADYKNLTADDILVTIGGSEAIYILMSMCLEPGDRVIVEKPIYQSLFQVAEDAGLEVDHVPLVAENGFAPDIDDMRKKLEKKKAAMVVINHPHSPTGSLISPETQKEIASLCEKHGALFVSDEVYWGVFYREEDKIPHAADISDNAVTIGDMTKPYGLGGLRIGWLATKRKDVMKKVELLKEYTSLCPPGPSELLATHALAHSGAILKRNIEIARKNIDLVDRLIADFAKRGKNYFSWARPRGGYTGFVKTEVPGMTTEEFCMELIKEKSVLLLPGRVFGDPERFRIGVGTNSETFSRGLSDLSDFLIRF